MVKLLLSSITPIVSVNALDLTFFHLLNSCREFLEKQQWREKKNELGKKSLKSSCCWNQVECQATEVEGCFCSCQESCSVFLQRRVLTSEVRPPTDDNVVPNSCLKARCERNGGGEALSDLEGNQILGSAGQ